MPQINRVAIAALSLVVVACCGCSDNRVLEVSNVGASVVDLRAEVGGQTRSIRLGEQGRRVFPSSTHVQMGETEIRVGERIEVAHSGPNVIRIHYKSDSGEDKTMMLGDGGTGYFSRTTALAIGDARFTVKSND